MKQNDYLMLVVIAIISGVLSVVLSGYFFSSEADRSQTAEVVQPLSSNFERPPQEYFNEDSVNPTRIIEIGPQETSPFEAQ